MARSRRRDDDDDDDDDDRPAKKKSRARDDDEEEDDPPPRKKRASRDDDEDEDDRPAKKKPAARSRDDDDDEDEDDRPAKKKPAPAKSRARDDDEDEDEDDEDDRPAKKKSRARDDDDEDEDDEDDDRPSKRRGKKAKKKSGGPNPLIFVFIGVGALVLLGGGGALAFFLLMDTPEKAFEDVKAAGLNKDYGKLFDRMDKESQAKFDKPPEGPGVKMVFGDKLNGKKGKDLFVTMMKEFESKSGGMGMSDKDREDLKNSKVEKVTVDGDTATMTIRKPDGKLDTAKLVKQDGTWRMKSETNAFSFK